MYGLVALNLPGLHSACHLSTRDLDRGRLYVPLKKRREKKSEEKTKKGRKRTAKGVLLWEAMGA